MTCGQRLVLFLLGAAWAKLAESAVRAQENESAEALKRLLTVDPSEPQGY